MPYNEKRIKNGQKIVVESGGVINMKSGSSMTDDGTQASHVADVTITTDLTGVDTGTDMTAAQASAIETDLAAIETAINAINAVLEGIGAAATS